MDTQLKVADVFSHHMVLQHATEIPIWGTANDGIEITVEFCGQLQKTTAKDGKWFLNLSSCPIGGPFEMRITNGTKDIILEDILIGDVWVAGGQSNMQYTLGETREGKAEISLADYEGIRYYSVPKVACEEDSLVTPCMQWQKCKPEYAKSFSAVAYHFAQEIHRTQGLPIGIVDCNWGGTSASCWIREDKLQEEQDLRIYLDEYNAIVDKQDINTYEEKVIEYQKAVDQYLEKKAKVPFDPENIDAYFADQSAGDYPWPPPMGEKAHRRPSGLYKHMLRKIVPYAIKGIIWYQGEEDTSRPQLYQKLFTKVIENWREDWNNPTLPFLFVQLASYGNNNPVGIEYALLREQQAKVSKSVPNTAMAISFDYGDQFNIHPTRKKAVGERLSLLARAKVYGEELICSGPIYRDFIINGNKIALTFDYAESGLMAKDGDLKGFYIAGEDLVFEKANAIIAGETIEVSCKTIDQPKAVRYCFSNYDEGNLYNGEGLPACPFRTDCEG